MTITQKERVLKKAYEIAKNDIKMKNFQRANALLVMMMTMSTMLVISIKALGIKHFLCITQIIFMIVIILFYIIYFIIDSKAIKFIADDINERFCEISKTEDGYEITFVSYPYSIKIKESDLS